MWVMTTGGFVSAVAHFDDKSKLMVRGRDKKSLEIMLSSIGAGMSKADQPEWKAPEIQSQAAGEHWDYPHRVVVSKIEFQYFLLEEVDSFLDYGNFKTAATHGRGEQYHQALMNVWVDMRKMTEPEYRTFSKGTLSSYVPSAFGKSKKTSAFGEVESSGFAKSTTKNTGTFGGVVYEWDDDGNITGQNTLFHDIHSQPLDVDPTDDSDDDGPELELGGEIVDVDEDGIPIFARTSAELGLGDNFDDELTELDDAMYRVNVLDVSDPDVTKSDDELFEAYLASMQRDDTDAGEPDKQVP